LLFSMPLYAQTASSPRAPKVVNWTDEKDQTGGVDLLESAAKKEEITPARPAGATPAPVALQKPQPTSSKKPSTTTAANAAAAQTAKNAASSARTLDIPLEVGTTPSVQATVAPAPRAQTQKPAPQQAPTDSQSLPSAQPEKVDQAAEAQEEEEADAELEAAVRMWEKSKREAASGRPIPPSAAKNKTATVPAANKKFNPNAYRPGVEWTFNKSAHFDIYTQKPTNGAISSPNMALAFETAYQTLRRFIPWMMASRVRVFVYQDHNAYIKYEPEAKAWTRAVAYPTRGEIVVYDEPGKQQDLKEVFTHELTHIFTQNFFDKHKTGRIMTPTWLDEGLAVLIEDQAYNGSKGGPWNRDFQTLNLQRDPSQEAPSFSSNSMFGGFGKKSSFGRSGRRGGRMGFGNGNGKPVHLTPFATFMQEGSLDTAEGQDKLQKWYLQAYLMVRFLLNPAGGSIPSNRMQFEQFTRLLAEGEAVRNPGTGFIVKDSKGRTVYQPYDVEKALGRTYRYNNIANFEENFWRWVNK